MEVRASIEYQRALTQRLQRPETIRAFVEARRRMGLGVDVGLGSLPLAHDVYSAAMMVNIYKSGDGGYTHQDNGLFPESVHILPNEAGQLFAVPPQPLLYAKQSDPLWLVSIYQKKGPWDHNPAHETRLLDVTDKILTGFFAHEFAHYVQKVLGVAGRAKSVHVAWERTLGADVPVGAGPEAAVDLIAASLGFREEILAKNQYTMGCLATYVEPLALTETGFAVRPSEAMAQLRYRNEQVIRFVP
jgi:hypothetical protein